MVAAARRQGNGLGGFRVADDRLLTDEEWNELIRERDAFKLAIRGQTAIEGEVDAAIAEAFVGPMPKDLNHTTVRFQLRLAMLVGLGVIAPEWRPLFTALSNLRNDFAHGKIRELDADRARTLLDATHVVDFLREPPAGETDLRPLIASLRSGPPAAALVYALLTARSLVQSASRFAKERREEEQRIVALHRIAQGRRSALLDALAAAEAEAEAADEN
jgi:hypothetical protein